MTNPRSKPPVRPCDSLRNLVSRLLPHGVQAQVEVADDLEPPPEVEALVFRVAQESLINIARHARARHVTLAVQQDDAGVELLVTDDGTGYDADRARRGAGHFGLSVLADLGREARATLGLATGTAVRLRVPIA